MKRGAMIALVVAIGACGSDSNSVLNGNVSGQWTYNASNLVGSGSSCSVLGVTMSLTQFETNFTGSTSDVVTVTCSAGGQTFTQSAARNQVIANGVVSGSSVRFDIASPDFHNVGAVSGNFMSGRTTLRLPVGGSTLLLSGNFFAVRQ